MDVRAKRRAAKAELEEAWAKTILDLWAKQAADEWFDKSHAAFVKMKDANNA